MMNRPIVKYELKILKFTCSCLTLLEVKIVREKQCQVHAVPHTKSHLSCDFRYLQRVCGLLL